MLFESFDLVLPGKGTPPGSVDEEDPIGILIGLMSRIVKEVGQGADDLVSGSKVLFPSLMPCGFRIVRTLSYCKWELSG